MHKAPIVESKQIEHVINERKILEEACMHPFCVRLCGAYQDKSSLFLLQASRGMVSAFQCTALARPQRRHIIQS